VSRHHFHALAVDGAAYLRVCAGASPLLYAGSEVRDAIVAAGEAIVVGNTLVTIAEVEAPDAMTSSSDGGSTVDALFDGPAADVRALAAVFALEETLAAVDDLPSLERALTSWARGFATCDAVEMDAAQPAAVAKHALMTWSEIDAADGRTQIIVPAHGTRPRWIAFTILPPRTSVTDLLRRLLAIAGRICASRTAQISALSALKEDRESLRRQAIGSARGFGGGSEAVEKIVRILPKLAASTTTVLLTGETGVGKTFVARLIHEASPRKNEPLRIINCAAIPEHLIESELFGHERGALSGAGAARAGAFEATENGTLLLDEIGELPLAGQAKLLRVLEEKRYERIGSNQSRALHARILVATNRDLETMVRAGTFREDLFFRISVVRLLVPALRERGDDVVLLARQILADLSSSADRRVDDFAPEALATIRRYPWPGNVRELRDAVEHALVVGEERLIAVTDFPAIMRKASSPPDDEDLTHVTLPLREDLLLARNRTAALHESAGNKTRAAAILGIERTTFYKKRRGN
ncbi:MAG TPA: sigma-54 dependent transcriptional regulator, partial [Polyangiaceae bacterium]|nr:sigma-54 dependent transcriptional regulator [Polyangiaceae bacterium]